MSISSTTSVTVDFTSGQGNSKTITVQMDNYNSGNPVVHYLDDSDIVDTKDYVIAALIAKYAQTEFSNA